MSDQILKNILSEGFPTSRDEAWKYTNVSAVAARPFMLSQKNSVTIDRIKPYLLSDHYLVFVNGYLDKSLSSIPEEVSFVPVESFKKSYNQNDIFHQLNQHFPTEAVQIRIEKSTREPLQILYYSESNHWVLPRVSISIENNVKTNIIETFYSDASSITNAVTKVQCQKDSVLTYLKLQRESEAAFHVGRTFIELAESSEAEIHLYSFGSKLCRSDIDIDFQGENGKSEVYGLYLGKKRQHVDYHTAIYHQYPNCKSSEMVHGIVTDKSRAVFNGKVVVKPHAHQSETELSNHNLLLSSDAEIDTKPELEIYHDNVKCSHGATIGQLEEEAIYYLQSRGLSLLESKQILIRGFAHKITEKLPISMQDAINAYLEEALCLD